MQVGRRIHLALRHETARPNGGFKGRRRFTEPTPPLKNPFRSTSGCCNKGNVSCSAFYKWLKLHSNKFHCSQPFFQFSRLNSKFILVVKLIFGTNISLSSLSADHVVNLNARKTFHLTNHFNIQSSFYCIFAPRNSAGWLIRIQMSVQEAKPIELAT